MAIDRKTINQITSVDPNLSANGEFIVEQDGSTFKTAVSAIATYFGTVTGVQGSGINNNLNDSNYSGIFAGDGNSMPFNTSCSFIGAGMSNIVEQSGAFIGAGCSNTIHSFGTGVLKGPFTHDKILHKWEKSEETGEQQYKPQFKAVPKLEAVSVSPLILLCTNEISLPNPLL